MSRTGDQIKEALNKATMLTNYAEDESGYNYYGCVNTDNSWAIMREKIDGTENLYAAGLTGYAAAWTGRAGLTYATPDVVGDNL